MERHITDLQKKKEKIETKVAQLLEEQMQTDRGEDEPPGPGLRVAAGSSRWKNCTRRPS